MGKELSLSPHQLFQRHPLEVTWLSTRDLLFKKKKKEIESGELARRSRGGRIRGGGEGNVSTRRSVTNQTQQSSIISFLSNKTAAI